jgi:hypothetical protein
VNTPALDFLRKVQVWQEDEANRTAGLVVVMPDQETDSLSSLLGRQYDLADAERRARTWLIGYQQLEDRQRVLTEDQRAELNAIVARLQPESRRPAQTRRLLIVVVATIGVVLAIALGLGIRYLVVRGTEGNRPPSVVPAQQAPVQQVPAGNTSLQVFQKDWGPFTQLPADLQHPQTGAPALVLLSNGGYYVTKWKLPANDPLWQDNLDGGNISATDVQGSHAIVVDADGTQWVVGIRQPFVLARDPGLVLRVEPDGTVLSLPESRAIAVRNRI